ncbi:MAG: outer membrane beta-barrel protein [Bacteroidota bacterium]
MRKWILIIATHLLLLPYAFAQDQVGCSQLLEDAKEAYAAGMVELVPELLNACIESGLAGQAKQEAYVLVITAYLFDYLPEEADVLMGKLLDEFPNYQSKPSDPVEFTMLLKKHKDERMARQAELQRQAVLEAKARQEEQARLEEEKRQQKSTKNQETKRKNVRPPGNSSSPGAGFILGTNLSMPQLLEPFSVTDPLAAGGKFGIATPGFHIGAALSFPLSASLEASVEMQYQRVRFSYAATPFSFTSNTYDEVQNRFALPVSCLFHLNPGGQTKFYFRLGIVADYLLSASASAIRSYTDGTIPDVVLDKTDMKSSRSGLNLYALAGAGIKVPLQHGFFFAETRFQYGFFDANKASERYNNQDMIWLIYHVDSDFKLHQLSISAGMVFYLN